MIWPKFKILFKMADGRHIEDIILVILSDFCEILCMKMQNPTIIRPTVKVKISKFEIKMADENVTSPHFSEILSDFDEILYAKVNRDNIWNPVTKTQNFWIQDGGQTPFSVELTTETRNRKRRGSNGRRQTAPDHRTWDDEVRWA